MGIILVGIYCAAAAAGIAGWIALWYLTVTRGAKLLKPIFGDAADPICLIGYPFFIGGLLLAILKVVPRENQGFVLITLGLSIFGLGAWVCWGIRKGKIDL